jgi:nitrite reductase/ring-hydroxylating ferredoxin subunit
VNSAAALPPWTLVASLPDFRGQRQLVRKIGDLQVLLLRVGTEIIALHDSCTHLGKSLLGGRLMGGQITCPFHGACFDVQTGVALSGPAVAPLRRFPVQIDGECILVDVTKGPVKSAGQP